jgi:phospholipase C
MTHVVVVVQENHSFDNYFARFSPTMQPDAEALPDDFTNLDANGVEVAPLLARLDLHHCRSYFAPVLAGTWANRDYLYAGTSRGVHDSFTRTIPDVPTLFNALSAAGVTWGIYTDGEPFQDTLYAVTLCCGFMQRPHVPQALADAITRGQLPLDPREVTYYLERHTFLAGSAGQMDAGARASSPS